MPPTEKPTAHDELIDALHEVPDLDALHQLLSNETTDTYGSPELSTWFVELVNAERRRRANNEAETVYPMHHFTDWPDACLYQAAALTLCIVEASLMCGTPTVQQFALRLHQVMVGSLGLAFLELSCGTRKPTT